jgi:hypothetical protein
MFLRSFTIVGNLLCLVRFCIFSRFFLIPNAKGQFHHRCIVDLEIPVCSDSGESFTIHIIFSTFHAFQETVNIYTKTYKYKDKK